MKILKTIYTDKAKWETIKLGLIINGGYVNGIDTVLDLGFLPKPPPAGWTPDPNNPEDNGWSTYSKYAVDLIVEDTFDYAAYGLDTYLTSIPKDILQFMHKIPSSEQIPVEFSYPDLSWLMDELIAYCDKYGIQTQASWTKQQIVDAIEATVIYN